MYRNRQRILAYMIEQKQTFIHNNKIGLITDQHNLRIIDELIPRSPLCITDFALLIWVVKRHNQTLLRKSHLTNNTTMKLFQQIYRQSVLITIRKFYAFNTVAPNFLRKFRFFDLVETEIFKKVRLIGQREHLFQTQI